MALAHYELHAWCLLVLAWVFVPFYARSLVFTMPEFLERRFSVHSRYVLSIVSLITFIVSKIAVGILVMNRPNSSGDRCIARFTENSNAAYPQTRTSSSAPTRRLSIFRLAR